MRAVRSHLGPCIGIQDVGTAVAHMRDERGRTRQRDGACWAAPGRARRAPLVVSLFTRRETRDEAGAGGCRHLARDIMLWQQLLVRTEQGVWTRHAKADAGQHEGESPAPLVVGLNTWREIRKELRKWICRQLAKDVGPCVGAAAAVVHQQGGQ